MKCILQNVYVVEGQASASKPCAIYLSMYKPSYLPDALKQQGLEFKAKNTKTLELKIR